MLLLQLAMLDVTSSCKSRVMFEAGLGKMEDELLNLLFLDEGDARIFMSGDDEPCSFMWFSTSLK